MNPLKIFLTVLLLQSHVLASDLCREIFDSPYYQIKVNTKKLSIPIFSDLHGDLPGLFRAIRTLQNIHQTKYPVVIVTGDFGFFPYPHLIPEVIARREFRYEHDKGVSEYFQSPRLHREFYENSEGFNRLEAKILFLRGNHEDQGYLARNWRGTSTNKRTPIAIDQSYNKLFYLPDGTLFNLYNSQGKAISFAVQGGIAAQTRPQAALREPLISFDYKGMDQLLDFVGRYPKRQVDVLLTHQGVKETKDGHEEINTLVDILNPKLNLHGHGHQAQGPVEMGNTKVYQLPSFPHDANARTILENTRLLEIDSQGELVLKDPSKE